MTRVCLRSKKKACSIVTSCVGQYSIIVLEYYYSTEYHQISGYSSTLIRYQCNQRTCSLCGAHVAVLSHIPELKSRDFISRVLKCAHCHVRRLGALSRAVLQAQMTILSFFRDVVFIAPVARCTSLPFTLVKIPILEYHGTGIIDTVLISRSNARFDTNP